MAIREKSRFIIKRTDKVIGVDNAALELEGLAIGRLITNDLLLNHRAVSRAHAGIKEIEGVYWLRNLSSSNGTFVNGKVIEQDVALKFGDVIQIGPYLLAVECIQGSLSMTVSMNLQMSPLEIEAGLSVTQADLSGETLVMDMSDTIKSVESDGTNSIPETSQPAFQIFWEKRKREAGKITGQTRLHPKANKRLGRAQNNWHPTSDLKETGRKSYFVWGSIVILALSVAGFLVYENAFSPGPLSTSHAALFQKERLLERNIATQSNAHSCSNCHGVLKGMLDKCIDCHTTEPFQAKVGFQPQTFIEPHKVQEMNCSDCHMEHMGTEKEDGLLNYGLCVRCHNGAFKTPKDGKVGPAGTILPPPHGGMLTGKLKLKPGYSIPGEVWKGLTVDKWKRVIDKWQIKVGAKKSPPSFYANKNAYDQFHLLHMEGDREDKRLCVICHYKDDGGTDLITDTGLPQASPAACNKCHVASGTTQNGEQLANCNTCHQQHGRAEQFASLTPKTGKDLEFLAALSNSGNGIGSSVGRTGTVGTASAIRHNKDTLNIGSLYEFGALPWYGWLGFIAILPIAGLAVMVASSARLKNHFGMINTSVEPDEKAKGGPAGELASASPQTRSPAYPHPMINTESCIGCHACVEACPHDVLAIVGGKATPLALDQCMEDTSCQVECPTNPKSCIVINTTKVIPPRKAPVRDSRLNTNVKGIYLIGDVSGVPLIKNAINEGRKVIDSIQEDIESEGPLTEAKGAAYDVAIIGAGPAGLSAAVLAKKAKLSYVAIEQDKIAATIQASYNADKFIFFTPKDQKVIGGIPLILDSNRPEGNYKEAMLQSWYEAMMQNGVEVKEEEGCNDIKQENGIFIICTEKGKLKEKATYKARKVILAIGNRGTPMRLGVPGEDIKFMIQPPPVVAVYCPKCGTARYENHKYCINCGMMLILKTLPVYEDSKVQYKLTDAKEFFGKKCIVVGAGNSAIEVALALTGFKREGNKITFESDEEVTLIVRRDFKGDLALSNKMNIYDCIDMGRIRSFFGCVIKEIKENEVIIVNEKSKKEIARIKNDYVFALIGGEKPTTFLKSLGIKIGEEKH